MEHCKRKCASCGAVSFYAEECPRCNFKVEKLDDDPFYAKLIQDAKISDINIEDLKQKIVLVRESIGSQTFSEEDYNSLLCLLNSSQNLGHKRVCMICKKDTLPSEPRYEIFKSTPLKDSSRRRVKIGIFCSNCIDRFIKRTVEEKNGNV